MPFRCAPWGWLAVPLLAGAIGVEPARAHGPCGCLDPRVVPPGGQVRITAVGGRGVPAYRVIFNPRRRDLGIAPGYLAGAFRVDAPSRTVLSRSRRSPTLKARFRVPRDAPPGLYMVLIFDGDEGGAHNTWEYLHVVEATGPDPGPVVGAGGEDPPPRPALAPGAGTAAGASPEWLLLVLGLAVGTGAGLAGGTWHRRRAQ